MTRTIEEQIAILYPVASRIRLLDIAEAVRLGKAYVQDVDDALSTLGEQRARALARLTLATPLALTAHIGGAPAVDGVDLLEAIRTAREVLGK